MRPNRFAPDKRTMADERQRLSVDLAGTRDEILLALTPEQMARRYKLPAREVECKLLAAQANLRRFLAGDAA